jgi:4-hydroxy-3-polyprenylbenzoate decarboxylase
LIVAREDNPELDIHDIPAFFRHLLERVDWANDLHFQTRTTIDTLDYSGTGLNEGSKLVIAAAGPSRRSLPVEVPNGPELPAGFTEPRVCLPGVLALKAPRFDADRLTEEISHLTAALARSPLAEFPLIVLVDDSGFTAQSVNNFLWVTFTRSNPAADCHGVGAFTEHKHWGCTGPLVIDARVKPHHAPALEPDPAVSKRVDELAARGGPLHGIF